MPSSDAWTSVLADLLAEAESHCGLIPPHALVGPAMSLGVTTARVAQRASDEIRRRERHHPVRIDDALAGRLAEAADLATARAIAEAAIGPVDLPLLVRALRRVPGWQTRHLVPLDSAVPGCTACAVATPQQLGIQW